MSLSTHVLDTARGVPASGVPVILQRHDGHEWMTVADGQTDMDGRLRDWVSDSRWGTGLYRLVFNTAAYQGPDAFFPEVMVVFTVHEPHRHHHIPLLLSPFGYSTYRGS